MAVAAWGVTASQRRASRVELWRKIGQLTFCCAHPEPRVEIHPEAAAPLGIADGDWVTIATRRGAIRQRARLTNDIHPRVVNAEHGWWFPEEPGPEHGVWRSNANLLTDNGPPYDPAMGTYSLRALLCRIERGDDSRAGADMSA